MSRGAELARHHFDFALVEATADGIEEDFHGGCRGGVTPPLRLHHNELVEDDVHEAFIKRSGQQSHLAAGEGRVVDL